MEYDYEVVPIDPRGVPSSVASRIEAACKQNGQRGFQLKNEIRTNVERSGGEIEEVLFLIFEKVISR